MDHDSWVIVGSDEGKGEGIGSHERMVCSATEAEGANEV